MRPGPLLLACALFCLPACSGGGGGDDDDDTYTETGRVEITMIVPPAALPAQDPFTGVTTFHLAILDSLGAVVAEDDFGPSDPIEIQSLDPGTGRVVVLEGRSATGVISRGRTLPFDIVEGPTPVTRTLYFSRTGEFSTVYGTAAARTGAATWTFSDGRVLIAGGLDAGAALASSEIFDWETDSTVSAGTMPAGGTAFSVAATLGSDMVLICGGVTDATGDPTAIANIYEHTPGGVGTWKAGVPAMPVALREHAGAEIGAGRVLIAGGSSTNAAIGPPLDTTYLLQWSGASGSWSAGTVMHEARMGAMALPASGDVVIFQGGYKGPGGDNFTKDGDVYQWNGVSLALTGGGGPQIGTSRGWSGVLEIVPNQWLVWGGEEGTNGGHNVMDLVELWTWNGSQISSDGRQNLAVAQRGGAAGVLTGDQILLLGGSTGVYPTDVAADTASIYDVVGDQFTNLSPTPGPTLGGTAAPLPDGTSLVVIDGAVLRFNPL